jgi:hypothetical protein
MESLVGGGYLLRHELSLLIKSHGPDTASYWVPMNWVFSLCYQLRDQGPIKSDPLLNGLVSELRVYRERLQTLLNFDWVPVPLGFLFVFFLN